MASAVLAPLASLYAVAARLNNQRIRPHRAAVPVICVGNLVAGGTGKTPVALALASLLAGREIAFLTRGYGGTKSGPLRVEAYRHRADEVGDEPLLLARVAPTWVSPIASPAPGRQLTPAPTSSSWTTGSRIPRWSRI